MQAEKERSELMSPKTSSAAASTAKAGSDRETRVTIKPPNFQTAIFHIIGTSPYVQHKFAVKAREIMRAAQEAGSTSRSKRAKEAKDFEAAYQGAMYITDEGWSGIPAPAFRNGMISACRTVGYKMTLAKLSVFVEADGYDLDDGTPLVRILKGIPHSHEAMVRLPTGVADIRARPMWDPGWEADVRVTFDGDQFTIDDVTSLMMRVGMQVGVGEGRHDSKESAGVGWGTFRLGE